MQSGVANIDSSLEHISISNMSEHDLLEVVEIEEQSQLSRWGWAAYYAELQGINRSSCSLRVESFEGLLVHYAVAQKADAIVRGIRAISDYEYELQMALMNRRLEPSLETVFMMPAETCSYVSSRLVKEVFQLGGKLTGLVPQQVQKRMKEKLKNK